MSNIFIDITHALNELYHKLKNNFVQVEEAEEEEPEEEGQDRYKFATELKIIEENPLSGPVGMSEVRGVELGNGNQSRLDLWHDFLREKNISEGNNIIINMKRRLDGIDLEILRIFFDCKEIIWKQNFHYFEEVSKYHYVLKF